MIDMNKHIYLYRVTLTMKDAEKYYYVGIRSCKCEPEDDTEYLGSPKTYKHMWSQAETIKKDIIISLPHNKENHENLSAKEMLLIKEAHTRYGLKGKDDDGKCLNVGMFPYFFSTEEVRLRHAIAHNKQEVRDKKSLSGIKYYEDPEARKKTSQSLILYYADQDARDRHSVIMRKQETRDKIAAVMKKRWEDPEARKKLAAGISNSLKEFYKNNPNIPRYRNIEKTCEVCSKTMNIQNFVRHNHGENCKRG